MKPIAITSFTTTTAVGTGQASLYKALQDKRSGLAPCRFDPRLATYTGMVDGLDHIELVDADREYDCRNNRIARLGLQQDDLIASVHAAIDNYGPTRIGVVFGTSTSGIGSTEIAYQHRDPDTGQLPVDYNFKKTHNLFSAIDYVMSQLGLKGPGAMISTACSSSAKVFASAYRLMKTGFCDAVLVGGIDSLCLNTLYGFSSLELVSTKPCAPFSALRSGISIGEAAGYALLEWPDNVKQHSGISFIGYGESSDAYHMSTPHPEGAGAILAMQRALQSANLAASDISYINAHGTATKVNDEMEDKAIHAVFGSETPCSSTKGWTGHTLGAAGITEAIISMLCIQNSFMPATLNMGELDSSFRSQILKQNVSGPVNYCLTNSFGFGGSNCSLIFGQL